MSTPAPLSVIKSPRLLDLVEFLSALRLSDACEWRASLRLASVREGNDGRAKMASEGAVGAVVPKTYCRLLMNFKKI